jgi:TonB-linked SusC/RagA family outer membrane protein
MRKILFSLLLFTCIIQAVAQQTITGVVSDASDGSPLPGVTITVKGTNTAAMSDLDGKFSLNAPSDATLLVTFMGYKTQELAVNGQTVINVQLEVDDQTIEEVVVTGYGVQKKSVVTGSISSVKSKDLEKLPVGRIEQTMQGRIAGVTIASNSGQPGSSSTIRVRGITTFNDNNPLWVVDGVVVDNGGIGYINQSDIESIEVLKDASSLAIYGARSASGVILVTTKQGSKGKINVSYNGYYGVSSPERKLNLLNSKEYATLMNEKSIAAGGSLVFADPSALGESTDWQDAIFNNSAVRYSNEISVSGGNDISSFFLSFGARDQEGIVATDISNYNSKNIRLNSTHKLSKYVTIGQTLGYSHQKTVGIGSLNSEYGGVLSSAINLDPTTPLVITDPAVAGSSPYSTQSVMFDDDGNPYGISTLVGQEMTNPLAYQETRLGNFDWSDDFVGNVYIEISPLKGLKFKSTFGGKLAYWGTNSYTPIYYLNATNNTARNNIYRANNQGLGYSIENTLSYTRSFDSHNFVLLLGQGAYADGIVKSSGVTYFDLPITNYEDASFNFGATSDKKDSWANEGTEHKVTSLFTRLNYDYSGKYLFTGIIRRDGSSRFGSNNKYGIFPSFSLGWVASRESFWPENRFVTQLKIRGGYGVTGNDAIGDFAYLSTVGSGRNYTFGDAYAISTGYSPNAPENPDLAWEETQQTNIGIETMLFNSLSLNFDYYIKKTKGILQDVEIPGYAGATGQPKGNVADMKNNGIELELGYRKKFGEVNISVNANFAYLKNEVTYVGLGKTEITGYASFQSMGAVTVIKEGLPFNSFYGFEYDGIFQNADEVAAYVNDSSQMLLPNAVPGDMRWVDLNGDGKIDDKDKKDLGSSLPKYTYGLTLNADYKGFDLMVFFQGAGGNKIFQGLRRLDIINSNYQNEALNRWTGEGTTNTYPRLTNNDANLNFGRMSSLYLEKGDYLRCKILQLGYSLPVNLISKIGASRLRFYLSGENLFTFTKYTGYDPEIGGGVFGIDKGYYPQARTFMFGVNLQF